MKKYQFLILVFISVFIIIGCTPPHPPTKYTITATAGIGGSILPNGDVTVEDGDSQTFTIIPDSGYNIESVLVDGVNKGAISSYPFDNVHADHTIRASFSTTSTLQFSSTTYDVNENGGSVTVSVIRTGGSNGAVGVSYATSDGTAIAGDDYTSKSGTLSWNDGDTSTKSFSVNITDDSDSEGDETFTVNLSDPSGGANLGSPDSAAVTIIDDETPPVLEFKQFIPGIEGKPGNHAVHGVALSPVGTELYAAHWTDSGSDPIGVYSTSDYSLLRAISVGRCVFGVVVSPDGRYVFGPCYYNGSINRFDTLNNYTETIITLGSWATGLWINPDGTKLIVNYNDSSGVDPSISTTLALVDILGGNFSLINTLSMERHVSGGPVAFSSDGNYMYVSCSSSMTMGPSLSKISIISFTIIGTCELTTGAGQVKNLAGVVRLGSNLYIADKSDNKLYVVDEVSFTKTSEISLPYAPWCIALHPDGKYLFVLYGDNCSISVLNLPSLTVATSLSGLNLGLGDIKFSSDGKTAYIAHYDQTEGGFSVVDCVDF